MTASVPTPHVLPCIAAHTPADATDTFSAAPPATDAFSSRAITFISVVAVAPVASAAVLVVAHEPAVAHVPVAVPVHVPVPVPVPVSVLAAAGITKSVEIAVPHFSLDVVYALDELFESVVGVFAVVVAKEVEDDR